MVRGAIAPATLEVLRDAAPRKHPDAYPGRVPQHRIHPAADVVPGPPKRLLGEPQAAALVDPLAICLQSSATQGIISGRQTEAVRWRSYQGIGHRD